MLIHVYMCMCCMALKWEYVILDECNNGHSGCDNHTISHLYKLSIFFANRISCQLKIHSHKIE